MRRILFIISGILLIIAIGLGFYLYLIPKFSTENRQIDAWIAQNGLNHYGDPQNTAYSNQKPCSNARDCYQYIKKMHPNKPWQ